jgi:hypothetical protein
MKDAAEIIQEINKIESLCRTPALRNTLAQFLIIAEGLAELEKVIAAFQQGSPEHRQTVD